MKEIMQTYGSMIVATIIAIMLFTCLPAVRSQMSGVFVHQDLLSDVGNNDRYDSYRSEAVPKIEVRDRFFGQGTEYRIGDILCAVSETQNLEEVRAYAMYDSEKNDYSSYIAADGKSLHFPGSGIYIVYAKIICKNGIEDHAIISIPVNQKEAGGIG